MAWWDVRCVVSMGIVGHDRQIFPYPSSPSIASIVDVGK